MSFLPEISLRVVFTPPAPPDTYRLPGFYAELVTLAATEDHRVRWWSDGWPLAVRNGVLLVAMHRLYNALPDATKAEWTMGTTPIWSRENNGSWETEQPGVAHEFLHDSTPGVYLVGITKPE